MQHQTRDEESTRSHANDAHNQKGNNKLHLKSNKTNSKKYAVTRES